jgi:hypothetical protein
MTPRLFCSDTFDESRKDRAIRIAAAMERAFVKQAGALG